MNLQKIKQTFLNITDFLKENYIFFIYFFVLFILLCYCFFVAYQLNEISAQYELCIQNNQQILNLSKEVLKSKEFLIEQVEIVTENKDTIKPSLNRLLENQELQEEIEFKLSKPGDQAKNP
jgi:predicted negative regulator of RcsB-dependent stress response